MSSQIKTEFRKDERAIGQSYVNNTEGKAYEVKKGETLARIAKENNVSLKELIEANPQIKDPNKIYVGQEINIPERSSRKGKASSESQDTSAPYNKDALTFRKFEQAVGGMMQQWLVSKALESKKKDDVAATTPPDKSPSGKALKEVPDSDLPGKPGEKRSLEEQAKLYDKYQTRIPADKLRTGPNEMNIVGMRHNELRLEEKKTDRTYDDQFVVLWTDKEGNKRAEVFSGGTHPGQFTSNAYSSVNKDAKADLAWLKPGSYDYKMSTSSKHGKVLREDKFSQDGKLQAWRDTNNDGKITGNEKDTIYNPSAILFHEGFENRPKSAGCQTMSPKDFHRFMDLMGDDPDGKMTYTLVNANETSEIERNILQSNLKKQLPNAPESRTTPSPNDSNVPSRASGKSSAASALDLGGLMQIGTEFLKKVLLESVPQQDKEKIPKSKTSKTKNGTAKTASTSVSGQSTSSQGKLYTEREKSVAFQIVGAFEGGKPDKLQTKDAGIISYGSHQATLSAGSLEQVLKRYIELAPDSPIAKKLQSFMKRVADKDPSLAKSSEFLGLLKEAAKEPQMQKAQDDIFTEKYFDPAAKKAHQLGLKSPMAKALLFDACIQGGRGGMKRVVRNTLKRFEGKNYTEKEFLQAFVEERKKSLLRNSERSFKKAEKLRSEAAELRATGQYAKAKQLEEMAARREKNGKFLEISANESRGPALARIVESENWDLKGEFRVKGKPINGG